MTGRIENLRPWKSGESGNPGGRPKTKPLTSELERRLEQEAPKGKGHTWAVVIAEALLAKARKGDVRAASKSPTESRASLFRLWQSMWARTKTSPRQSHAVVSG